MLQEGQRVRSTRRSYAPPRSQGKPGTGERDVETNRSRTNSHGQQYAAPRSNPVINVAKEHMVGWNAGCAERCLSGVGRARRKPAYTGTAPPFYSIHLQSQTLLALCGLRSS